MDPLPFGVENTISSVPQPPRSLEGSYDSSSGDSPVSSHSSNGIHTGFGGSIITIPPTRKLPPLHPHTAMVTHLPQTLTSEWWIFFNNIFPFSTFYSDFGWILLYEILERNIWRFAWYFWMEMHERLFFLV